MVCRLRWGSLVYAPDSQLSLAAVESGDQPPGFHGIAGEAVHPKLFAPGVLRLLKGSINVANGKFMGGGAIGSGLFAEQDLIL